MMTMSLCRFFGLCRLRTPLKLMSRWSSNNVMNPGRQGTLYGNVQSQGENTTFYDNAKKEILNIVENLVTKPNQEDAPFTVAEYGAGDGLISMELMTDIISVIRSKCGKEKEIHVMYEDLPQNDSNSLFKGIRESYLQDHENVYVTSTEANFYKQCFPSNSVDLAVSFTATQWLSEPVYLDDQENPNYDAATKQAADDWVLFLKNRTKELKPGGWAVFSAISGRVLFPEEPSCKVFQDGLIGVSKIWKDLFDCDYITEAELKRGTIAICFRSPYELKEPFNDSKELQNMGLKLHDVKPDRVSCFYVTERERKLIEQGIDDRVSFIRSMTKYLRTPAYNTFCGALGSERSEEQKLLIFEKVFQEMETWFLSKYSGIINPYCFYTSTYVRKE